MKSLSVVLCVLLNTAFAADNQRLTSMEKRVNRFVSPDSDDSPTEFMKRLKQAEATSELNDLGPFNRVAEISGACSRAG